MNVKLRCEAVGNYTAFDRLLFETFVSYISKLTQTCQIYHHVAVMSEPLSFELIKLPRKEIHRFSYSQDDLLTALQHVENPVNLNIFENPD